MLPSLALVFWRSWMSQSYGLWSGTAKSQRYIPIHSIAENLRNAKSSSMPYCSMHWQDAIRFLFLLGEERRTHGLLDIILEGVWRVNRCAKLNLCLPVDRKCRHSLAYCWAHCRLLYDRISMCQTVMNVGSIYSHGKGDYQKAFHLP